MSSMLTKMIAAGLLFSSSAALADWGRKAQVLPDF